MAELKTYLQERGVSVSGYLKNFAHGNRFCSQKNGFSSRSKLRKDQTTDELIIQDMLIPNPFSLETEKLQLIAAVWVVQHFLTI